MALINQDPDGATEEQKAQLATLQEQYAVGCSAVEAAKGELEVEKQEAQARLAEIEKKRAELSDVYKRQGGRRERVRNFECGSR